MPKIHSMIDPVEGKFYNYVTRDEKEERLLNALDYVLDDACPPDKNDYLCMMDESEEQRCKECWLRWATKDFKR